MSGSVTPCVLSPTGAPTNYHRRQDQRWGEVLGGRVTAAEATRFIVVVPGFAAAVVDRNGEPA